MNRPELRTEPSLGLLAADLVVLWLAWPDVFDSNTPVTLRVILGAVSLLAFALALWSTLMIVRNLRSGSAG